VKPVVQPHEQVARLKMNPLSQSNCTQAVVLSKKLNYQKKVNFHKYKGQLRSSRGGSCSI